jgi:hypothetical protein
MHFYLYLAALHLLLFLVVSTLLQPGFELQLVRLHRIKYISMVVSRFLGEAKLYPSLSLVHPQSLPRP